MESKKALILVDYQNDFCNPDGNLYIESSEELLTPIIKRVKKAKEEGDLTIATKDWHPKDHVSFHMWPVHGVKDTWGAEMPIDEGLFDKIINKGLKKEVDSYSGFLDDHEASNGLHEYLQANNVTDVVIIGIASDICVSATIQHAIELGYNVVIESDLCRGVQQQFVINRIKKRFN